MTFALRPVLLLLLAGALAAGCGGRSTIGSVRPPVPGATATPTPGSSSPPGTLNVAAVTTALQSAQTMFGDLPHQDLHADLTALASQMVASKQFATAVVTYGGITATLPDGTPALIFADHPEGLGYPPTAKTSALSRGVKSASARRTSAGLVARSTGASTRRTLDNPVSGPTQHEVAIFVNELDDSPNVFTPLRQQKYGDAFEAFRTTTSDFNVDVLDASLANIEELSGTHQIDYLSMNTHGMVAGTTNLYYAWMSTTEVDAASLLGYASDYAKGNIVAAVTIQYPTKTGEYPQWAFTPGFVTSHLTFNPGAIVDNQSCFGASPATLVGVLKTFDAAGVGMYTGWTKEVVGPDADQTDAFIFDRMLGEQSPSLTGLQYFAQQQTPPQRPFPFTDIAAVMHTENRAGPLGTGWLQSSEPYDASNGLSPDNKLAPPTADGSTAYWIASPLTNSSVANRPDEWALPSIARLEMLAETSAGGTMQIDGTFPSTPGSATITDGSGSHPLDASAWSPTAITVTLPVSGNGSAGNVQVLSDAGFASNLVPLTQWQGTIAYLESDEVDGLNGISGSGDGSLAIGFNLEFRADVHPTVPSIDASPAPQNLYFPQVENSSTATVTALSGDFTSAEGTPPPATATFSLSGTPAMSPQAQPLAQGHFIVGAIAGQPSPCNNGAAGPQGEAGNVMCPGFGYKPNLVGVCTPDSDDASLCGSRSTFSPAGSFGAAALTDPGPVMFTMDPATYAISVSAANTDFSRPFGTATWPATASVSGTIGAPIYGPTTTTPASRARRTPSR